MNWSKSHLKKVRKFHKEWHKENDVEMLHEIVSISTRKNENYYFERDYLISHKRYNGYYSTSVIGGNKFGSLKGMEF